MSWAIPSQILLDLSWSLGKECSGTNPFCRCTSIMYYLLILFLFINWYVPTLYLPASIYLFISLSFSICLSICLVIYTPICQFVNVFMHLSVYLLYRVIYLLIICLILLQCLFVCLSICLFIWHGVLSATNHYQINSEAEYSSRKTRAHNHTAGTTWENQLCPYLYWGTGLQGSSAVLEKSTCEIG